MSTVEQIKSRLGIVDVVQSYVKLTKAGSSYKACCPFHAEKTPSFFVSPARESWHCFGCSKGGDMFSFVMEMEGIDFVEALKILADRAGVRVEKINIGQKNERTKLLHLTQSAAIFYENELRKNSAVIDYLKKRGVKGEMAKAFGIGFAPEGWRNLYDFLKKKGYADAEMEKAGMVIKSSKGYYDRFRSRIMFPLANSSGQVVGFSGRIFGEQAGNEGKYVNTPQTVLYDKSRLLYAFDKAKGEIRKTNSCVLVEGQMDAIMSRQAGVSNTVAVSGTALTSFHLNLIKRLADKIIMAFDSDRAGISAAQRSISMALAEGLEVRAAVIPSGKDPADAVLEDPESWLAAVESARNIFDFLLEAAGDRKSVEGKILPLIAGLPSEIEKAQVVKKIADKFGISEEPVWQELKKVKLEPLSRSRLDSQGETLTVRQKSFAPKTRLEFLSNRLAGLALWQKESRNPEIKSAAGQVLERIKDYVDKLQDNDINKIITEAEIYFDGSETLKEEMEKMEKELSKEKLKNELEEITRRIRKLETEKAESAEKELESCLNDFHTLTKKLNNFK
ncbi:MAG: DNA primase [Candidatus Pacebacteria bacterium]|nr:DNA primase [Candidatus Paceibacterota bacterium]NUQ57060.1 DNA primase [Candidatus Paceibacter sp.]